MRARHRLAAGANRARRLRKLSAPATGGVSGGVMRAELHPHHGPRGPAMACAAGQGSRRGPHGKARSPRGCGARLRLRVARVAGGRHAHCMSAPARHLRSPPTLTFEPNLARFRSSLFFAHELQRHEFWHARVEFWRAAGRAPRRPRARTLHRRRGRPAGSTHRVPVSVSCRRSPATPRARAPIAGGHARMTRALGTLCSCTHPSGLSARR